jgi:hypothetical protein
MAGSHDNEHHAHSQGHHQGHHQGQQHEEKQGIVGNIVEKTKETADYVREKVTGHKDKPVTQHVQDKASDAKHDMHNSANKGADHAKHASNKH